MRLVILCSFLVVGFWQSGLAADKPTRLWNLTRNTLTVVELAPSGTEQFGPNQCLNDEDKSVDHDERLQLKGVVTGTYDIKITDKTRTCIAHAVVVETGKIVSLEEKQLADCRR